MKAWAACVVLLACGGFAASAGEPPQFQVTCFPETAYARERATFVLEGAPGKTVDVTFDGKPLTDRIFQGPVLEIHVWLEGSGLLRFDQGESSVVFHVVSPHDAVVLKEQAGYLHSERGHAILLMEHLHPPKHNRKWETVTFFRSLVTDTRPVVRSGMLTAPALWPGIERADLDDASGTPKGFWRFVPPEKCVSELNGLITARAALKPVDVLLIGLSAADFERGIDTLAFRMKLEWYLDSVDNLGFQHVFVAGPLMENRQGARFPDVPEAAALAAASHRAVPIDFRGQLEFPLTERAWFQPVMRRIRKAVKDSR